METLDWKERMRRMLQQGFGEPEAEAAEETNLPSEDSKWKKAMDARLAPLQSFGTPTPADQTYIRQGPPAGIMQATTEQPAEKPNIKSEIPKRLKKPVAQAPTPAKPETPLAQQEQDYWKPKTVKVDRNAGTVSYLDRATGREMELSNLEGIPKETQGIRALQQYLRQYTGLPETVEAEATPAATPATPAVAGGTPPAPTPTPKPPLQSPDLEKPIKHTLPGTPGVAEIQKGKSEEKTTKTEKGVAGLTPTVIPSAAQEALLKGVEQQQTLPERLKAAMNPLTQADLYQRLSENKVGAAKQYTKELDAAKKAEFWDRIVGALGKITAGGIGLGGLGIAGKQLVEPGLDVAKHYQTPTPFDRKAADAEAKERYASRLAEAEAPVKSAETLAKYLEEQAKKGAMSPESMKAIAALLKPFQTTTTETEGTEMGAEQGLIPYPPQPKGAKGAADQKKVVYEQKLPEQDKKREAQVSGYTKGRQAVTASASEVEAAVKATGVLDGTARKLVARLAAANPKPQGEADRDYWTRIRDAAIKQVEAVQSQDTSAPESARYSLWDVFVRKPAESADGSYEVIKRSSIQEIGGQRKYDYYDAEAYPDSRYNVLKREFSKKGLSGPELEEAIKVQLTKEASEGK